MSENENNSNNQQGYPYQTYPYYYYPQASPAFYPGYDMRQDTQQQPQTPMQQMQAPGQDVEGMLPEEQSYIENILRLNRGKHATVYMTFENNTQWNAKIFRGVVEAAGRDHIILSDPQTNRRYLLLMVYLDYITFDEELNYEYPFNG
ncbi:spore coat protein GerQ [Virgibacillus byunsanensis]|uniref:Spore coat protein GerQ n=1 Tax=Virgibacillus byunsanensis TaxID=570945 RepID=A0ABW3LHD3_9BACI